MPSTPIAPKRPHPITRHGLTRVDDYFWMRTREDPAALEYLKAENEYLKGMMEHTRSLQEKLYLEMKGRIKEDDTSAPERLGSYLYYTRTEAGKQYPFYCRKHGTNEAPEEILLDQNALAEGRSFCRIGAFAISPNQQMLAFSVDPDGSEKCDLYIKDLTTGVLYPERIPNTYGDVYDHKGVAWANDSATLFYATLDAAQRPYKLYCHTLGADPKSDPLLYHEADETYFLFVGKTRSEAYVTAYSRSTLTYEWRILPADQPQGDFLVFQPRQRGVEYIIEHQGDRFFVLTNEGARNFRLMETPASATSREHWKEVIPERPDVLLEDAAAFEDHLVLLERSGGLKRVRISAPDGINNVHFASISEPCYDMELTANPEFKTNLVRFKYSSLVTPNSVIDVNMESGEQNLVKHTEIPGGYDPSAYISQRLYAAAPDGTEVPISILYHKGLQMDGQNPLLLYGYGAYGSSTDASFNANRFSLVDRGFIFAIAHVRGGSEMGRLWYDNGKMLDKRNSFTDLIACAENLIAQEYTSTNRLAIFGRSAGGLLVCAAMTMRPDLFKAVVAQVPFVDVVTTMSDPSIPLTAVEYDQWGNPDDETFFNYLLSYSPYDNIRPAAYPNLLISAGLNDPRVGYWEPAKFTARLRLMNTSDSLILFETNMDAGHAGASGRYDYLKEIALDYAFLIDRLGARP